MKQVLAIITVLIAAHFAEAKVVCSVSESSTANHYDQNLFQTEMDQPKILFVKKGTRTVQEMNIKDLTTYEKWKDFDGATAFILSQSETAFAALSVAQVNVSNVNNILAIESTSMASIESKFLGVILPKMNLAISCSSL